MVCVWLTAGKAPKPSVRRCGATIWGFHEIGVGQYKEAARVFGGVGIGNCLGRRSRTLEPGITNDAARHLPQNPRLHTRTVLPRTRKRDEERDVWIVTARRGLCLAAGVAWLFTTCTCAALNMGGGNKRI